MSNRGLPFRILLMCLFIRSIETANALVDPCTQNKLEGPLDRTVILQPGEAPIAAALRSLGVSADLSTAFEAALQKYIPHGLDDGQRMRVRFGPDPNRFLVPIIVTVCGFAQALQNAEGGATGFNLFGYLPYWFEEEEGRANEVITKVQPFDTLSSILRQYGATTEEVTAIFKALPPEAARLKSGQKVRVLLYKLLDPSKPQPVRIIIMDGDVLQYLVALSSSGEFVSLDVDDHDRIAAFDEFTKYSAQKLVTISRFQWMRVGAQMIATFAVKNDNRFDIKDLAIQCHHFASSGTKIDTRTGSIFEIVKTGSSRTFRYDLGFVHSQVKSVSCAIQSVASIALGR